MKYKNIGKTISTNPLKAKLGNPKNLTRYEDKAKRTSKSNLTKGAFGRSER